MSEVLLELMVAWGRVDAAIQNVSTAMPFQMTAADEDLESERRAFRKAIQGALSAAGKLQDPTT